MQLLLMAKETSFLPLDGLLIVFDCSPVSTGKHPIREIEGPSGNEKGVRCNLNPDIPTTMERQQ